MQIREADVQYIKRRDFQSQYLAFPSACLSISLLAPTPTNFTEMAFAGRWETETQEGYDDFCKLLGEIALKHFSVYSRFFCRNGLVFSNLLILSTPGIPADIIEKGRDYKLITEVTQDGDTYSWSQIYPTNARVTNTFTIGKECDMETIGGKKFKVRTKDSRAQLQL